jgi:hypothetical protein
MIVTDLETVNPVGRLDVLVYKGVEKLAKFIEEKNGLVGIWDVVKPHVNSTVVSNVSGIEIPVEAKILLGILQANWKG